MAITYDFLADNIVDLLGTDQDSPDRESIAQAFRSKNKNEIAKLLRLISNDIRARSSTLPFPEHHEFGIDPPSKKIASATRYLDEIGRATGGEPPDKFNELANFDETGWHALGAAIQAIAGLLGHIEQVIDRKPAK